MELTLAEERRIIDGVKTFIDVFARSIAGHSARAAAESTSLPQQKPSKHKTERELEKLAAVPGPPSNTKNQNLPHLIPVTKWNQYHQYPSVGSLRWLIFNAEKTGFDKVLRRVGRRVLIDEAAFFEWVGNSGK